MGELIDLDHAAYLRAFNREPMAVGHGLADHPLLDLEALAQLADRLPPDSVHLSSTAMSDREPRRGRWPPDPMTGPSAARRSPGMTFRELSPSRHRLRHDHGPRHCKPRHSFAADDRCWLPHRFSAIPPI